MSRRYHNLCRHGCNTAETCHNSFALLARLLLLGGCWAGKPGREVCQPLPDAAAVCLVRCKARGCFGMPFVTANGW